MQTFTLFFNVFLACFLASFCWIVLLSVLKWLYRRLRGKSANFSFGDKVVVKDDEGSWEKAIYARYDPENGGGKYPHILMFEGGIMGECEDGKVVKYKWREVERA